MPIDARDCYRLFGETDKCDGVSSNALSLLDIVGPAPFALDLVSRKTLLERLGTKTYHDHGPMRESVGSPEQSVPKPETKPEIKPEAKPEIKPEAKPETRSEAKPELPVPKLELDHSYEQSKLEQQPRRIKQVEDLVELLPDHPIRSVSRALLKGLLTGEIDRQEVAIAMEQFTKAYITNLPPVTSDDFPLGDASEISLRLKKASIAFNNALTKLGLKMEVVDDRGIVIHNRANPSVNIGVRLTGEIDAFQGRLERKEYRQMKVQDAVAVLQPRAWSSSDPFKFYF